MAIKVVGFDADDTLWVNENYFREAEAAFCKLLSDFMPPEQVMEKLYAVEMQNLPVYGFGIKGFMLSMIETAVQIVGDNAPNGLYAQILNLGKDMLQKPVELMADVEHILRALKDRFKIILVTKGDLLDQQRKLEKSQLEKYFHHIEIMSNKHEPDYQKLIKHLDVQPEEFLMIGNSLRSDILPVLNIGAQAIYVPYEITWQHEQVHDDEHNGKAYITVNKLAEVLNHL